MSKQARLVDDLTDFAEFKSRFPGELRRDVLNGKTPKELQSKWKTLITARVIAVAITDPDTKAALAASKDILDRADGKAIERKQELHLMANVPEEQLDAALQSAFDKAYGNDQE